MITFLKAYGRPYLGISILPGQVPETIPEEEELVDKEVRDRFKRMCEGYYENVAKILVKEHNVRGYLLDGIDNLCPGSVYKNKTVVIMKRISDLAKYLRIDNKRMRR